MPINVFNAYVRENKIDHILLMIIVSDSDEAEKYHFNF
jgi:hypothetical protein